MLLPVRDGECCHCKKYVVHRKGHSPTVKGCCGDVNVVSAQQ